MPVLVEAHKEFSQRSASKEGLKTVFLQLIVSFHRSTKADSIENLSAFVLGYSELRAISGKIRHAEDYYRNRLIFRQLMQIEIIQTPNY